MVSPTARVRPTGRPRRSTVVMEIFGGALQSQVKCLSCGTESNKVDEVMDISLDVLHSNSLKDALQRFFQSELLDGQNKYKCERRNKLVAARKLMSILQAPNVLVIQLKRFDKSIAFEDFLVLSSFICTASQDPRPEYKLFGTIVHSGFSPESGHYYAYIKEMGFQRSSTSDEQKVQPISTKVVENDENRDYDGTLSPIVDDPDRAFMSNEAAVCGVAKYFRTSGRSRHGNW